MAHIRALNKAPFLFILLFCPFLVQLSSASDSAPLQTTLELSSNHVSEGFITLSWKDMGRIDVVELVIASDPDFHHVMRRLSLASQHQVHLSGFSDGSYYARLLDANGNVLAPDAGFDVTHRNLGLASMLFALGAGLFVFLLVTLFRFTYNNS
jgi:hypothetical protein